MKLSKPKPQLTKQVTYTHRFGKLLKKLNKKHPEIQSILDRFFGELKQEYPHKSKTSKKIMIVEDQPIYYHRLGITKKVGKRGGLRVVYGCKGDIIWGLYISAKADQDKLTDEDLKEIEEDFKSLALHRPN